MENRRISKYEIRKNKIKKTTTNYIKILHIHEIRCIKCVSEQNF